MSKYCKVEDVIRAIAEQLCWEARTEYGDKFTTEDWLEEAEDYVLDLPTIDIVHCKDCKHWKQVGNVTGNCRKHYFFTFPSRFSDFCSHGERIDNE